MGVVHYRYRSGVQTFSVPVPGAFASVADLKRLIAATARHASGGRTRGRGSRDGVALFDPRTGEEYVDENTMIPQNSMVLVHRIPGRSTDAIQIARTPTDTITASPIILENDAVASNKPVTESMQKSGAFTGRDDEEITAIRTVIDAAEIKWGGCLSGGGNESGQLGHHCSNVLMHVIQWKGRHPLLAMFAVCCVFLDISFGSAQQGTSRFHLAISATNVESQGTLFTLAQTMATGNMVPEEPVH